jgi:tRNA-splicing ligase RtcB
MEQAKNLANLPFAFKHIAIMPDCHEGYGMPIGGVLATRAVVVPNAVGVDIGCGMLARIADIQVGELETGDLKKVMARIRQEIPVGFQHRDEALDIPPLPEDAEGRLGYIQTVSICQETDWNSGWWKPLYRDSV